MGIADFARRMISKTTVAGVNSKLIRVIDGLDNQSKLFNRVIDLLIEARELQKAQLVMQRDQAEAIDQLAAAIRASIAADKRSAEFEASGRSGGTEPALKS